MTTTARQIGQNTNTKETTLLDLHSYLSHLWGHNLTKTLTSHNQKPLPGHRSPPREGGWGGHFFFSKFRDCLVYWMWSRSFPNCYHPLFWRGPVHRTKKTNSWRSTFYLWGNVNQKAIVIENWTVENPGFLWNAEYDLDHFPKFNHVFFWRGPTFINDLLKICPSFSEIQ